MEVKILPFKKKYMKNLYKKEILGLLHVFSISSPCPSKF